MCVNQDLVSEESFDSNELFGRVYRFILVLVLHHPVTPLQRDVR